MISVKAQPRRPSGSRTDPNCHGVSNPDKGPDSRVASAVDDVLADLDQIERSLDAILEPLDDALATPTPAEGWSCR